MIRSGYAERQIFPEPSLGTGEPPAPLHPHGSSFLSFLRELSVWYLQDEHDSSDILRLIPPIEPVRILSGSEARDQVSET